MLLPLIAALAVTGAALCALAAAGRRARRRRERAAKARLTAAAAAARTAEQRRVVPEDSDALTSLLPAIGQPWLTRPRPATPRQAAGAHARPRRG